MTISPGDTKIIEMLKDSLSKSHDPHRPVAVMITNREGNVVAEGTNSPPLAYNYTAAQTHRAIEGDPDWKYYMLEHAERNAILHGLSSGAVLRGGTLYGTLFPCADCARAIVGAGITRVVVPAAGLDPIRDERWRNHYDYARQVFDLAGTTIDYYEAGRK